MPNERFLLLRSLSVIDGRSHRFRNSRILSEGSPNERLAAPLHTSARRLDAVEQLQKDRKAHEREVGPLKAMKQLLLRLGIYGAARRTVVQPNCGGAGVIELLKLSDRSEAARAGPSKNINSRKKSIRFDHKELYMRVSRRSSEQGRV